MHCGLFTILVWMAVGARISDAAMLKITPEGDQYRALDSNIILTCQVLLNDDVTRSDVGRATEVGTSDQLVELKWRGPDLEFIEAASGRMHVEAEGTRVLRLFISGLTVTDAGRYTCELFVDGEQSVQLINILLYEEIKFMDTPTTVNASEGEMIKLPCVATGEPEPQISWRFRNRRIEPDDKKYEIANHGLMITGATKQDAGLYECRAEVESRGEPKTRNILINIFYAPVIMNHTRTKTVSTGEVATLHCLAEGFPAVQYEWLKEKKMNDVVMIKVKIAEAKSSTLQLTNVKVTDAGKYFCRASNIKGSSDVEINVNVLMPPKVDQFENMTTVEGRTLMWGCRASGDPLPNIQWARIVSTGLNDLQYQKLEGLKNVEVQSHQAGRSNLILHGVSRDDAAVYTCVAYNLHGGAEANATLTVHFAPTVRVGRSTVLGWQGHNSNLTCSAEGLPRPTITWSRGPHYVTSQHELYDVVNDVINDTAVRSVLTVRIREKQDWLLGKYSCSAKNIHGTRSEHTELKEAERPKMPHNVTIQRQIAQSVLLQLYPHDSDATDQQNSLNVTMWKVTYVDEGMSADDENSTKTMIQSNTDDGKLLVTDLQPDTLYTFHISAGSLVGFGPPIKFQVRTPLLSEQLDIPDDDALLVRSASDVSANKAAALGKNLKTNQSQSSAGTVAVIVIASLCLVGGAIAGAAIFYIMRRRSRESKELGIEATLAAGKIDHTAVTSTIGSNHSCDPAGGLTTPRRHPNDQLPDPGEIIICKSSPRYTRSPKLLAHTSPRKDPNVTSNQREAWEKMLVDRERRDDDDDDDRSSSSDDDGNEISIHEVLAGYHSEDNVDEIEEDNESIISS